MIFPSAIKNQMKLVSLFCFGADWADSFESSILNFFLKIYIYIFFLLHSYANQSEINGVFMDWTQFL